MEASMALRGTITIDITDVKSLPADDDKLRDLISGELGDVLVSRLKELRQTHAGLPAANARPVAAQPRGVGGFEVHSGFVDRD